MNIFHKVTLQSMKKSRTRTIVTIIGVILSAAMITAVATFAVSLQKFLVNGAVIKYGTWHVGFLDVDPIFVQERLRDKEAAETAILENIGYAELKGGENPEKPYLFIAGFGRETFDHLPIKLLSGRLPENSGEILVPAHLEANGGVNFSVGDTLTLDVGNRMDASGGLGQHDPYLSGNRPGENGERFVPKEQKKYTVVGICQRPSFEEFTAPGYTLITTADTTRKMESFNIYVTLDHPGQVRAYAAAKAGNYAYILNDDVLRFMGLSDDKLFNALLFSVAGILVALVMLGSIFLIYNSFNISLNERIRQFGILSSVGATKHQLRNSVLFEGFCIGLIGIPVGILIGIPSIDLVISMVSKNFRNIFYDTVPLTLTVSLPIIAGAAAVSMITILISAYLPARKAAGTPVMECIRQTNEIKVDCKAVKTSKLTERIWGLEGTLALKNFKRNKKRYRSVVLSLSFSMALFVSSNAFGLHLKQAAEQAAMETDYDICFYTQDMDEDELFCLYDKLKHASGVYDSSYQAVLTCPITVNTRDFSDAYRETAGGGLADAPLDLPIDLPTGMSIDLSIDLPIDIQFIEDSIYQHYVEDLGLSPQEYTGENAKLPAAAKVKQKDTGKNGRTVLIDMFADRTMTFQLPSGTSDTYGTSGGSKTDTDLNLNITFVDSIPVDTLPKRPSEVTPYVFTAVAPYQSKGMYEQKFESSGAVIRTKLGLTFRSENPSQTLAEMEAIIQSEGIASGYTLDNVYGMLEQNRNISFVVDLFTYVFVIMISLIATANVFNTISTNIKLRRRELAMLRSIGMSDRGFNKMMRFECAFYGMRTLLSGLPASCFLSWLIYKGMVIGGAEISFLLPWQSILISISGVFFVIFITMLYAVSRIKKENIIEALRDDMT
ncbi:FtsX-like permease family protein [Clostridium sp. MCC353]|uniref:ABC transporter permease n=1 Tax=Clostridium sp. MCC353 TaxID=2592646 RepID=UPI001C0359B5|nr:ABC transporter permease [Clostridium sp. MCC353]MBT9778464.1 FtsX-like permease family protein [Clostridium sp. MCC353]